MSQNETEHDRKVREYWAAAYNNDNHKQAGLPLELQYEPTAVLASQRNNSSSSSRKTSIYDIINLDLRQY
jgi:hypothetical protein